MDKRERDRLAHQTETYLHTGRIEDWRTLMIGDVLEMTKADVRSQQTRLERIAELSTLKLQRLRAPLHAQDAIREGVILSLEVFFVAPHWPVDYP